MIFARLALAQRLAGGTQRTRWNGLRRNDISKGDCLPPALSLDDAEGRVDEQQGAEGIRSPLVVEPIPHDDPDALGRCPEKLGSSAHHDPGA